MRDEDACQDCCVGTPACFLPGAGSIGTRSRSLRLRRAQDQTSSSMPPEPRIRRPKSLFPTSRRYLKPSCPTSGKTAAEAQEAAATATPPPDTQQASTGQIEVNAHRPALIRRSRRAHATRLRLALTISRSGLNGITRQLSDQEQTTAAHIREFIKQAREALKSGDVDGASTLAAKAKVLLQELTHLKAGTKGPRERDCVRSVQLRTSDERRVSV